MQLRKAGATTRSFTRFDAKAFLVGLSNASKWLGIMVMAVAPLADPGADVLGGLRSNEILLLPAQSPNGSFFTKVSHYYQTPALPPPLAPSVWDRITQRSRSAQGLKDTLLPSLQSKSYGEKLFQHLLRVGSSYKVLMFRAAAEVDKVCQSWLAEPLDADNVGWVYAGIELALHIVNTWDRWFGAIEAAAIEVISQLSPSQRMMLTYLSGHANHAILTLLDLLGAVDDQLLIMSLDLRSNFHWNAMGNLPTRIAQSREIRRNRFLHSTRLILRGAIHRNSLIYKRDPDATHRASRSASGPSTPFGGSSGSGSAVIRPQHLSLGSASAYCPVTDGLIDSPLGTWCHPYSALAVCVQAHATSALYSELKRCCSLSSSLGYVTAVSIGLEKERAQIKADLAESMCNLREIRDSQVFDVDY